MDRWRGRVAVVTGASAGIGAAIARGLVANGLTVVGLARRENLLQEMEKDLDGGPGRFVGRRCDLTDETDLTAAFEWVDAQLGGADIVVNNAGVMDNKSLLVGSVESWRRMLDVNVLSLCISSKLAINSMLARGVDDGHVININSLLGSSVMGNLLPFYTATKWAVTALCKSFQNELCVKRSHIRVTSVCPGLTRTEMVDDFEEGKLDAMLEASDVADAVMYALSAPPGAIVKEIKLAPNQGSVGHALAPSRADEKK